MLLFLNGKLNERFCRSILAVGAGFLCLNLISCGEIRLCSFLQISVHCDFITEAWKQFQHKQICNLMIKNTARLIADIRGNDKRMFHFLKNKRDFD